jgi:dipeptidyl aminopeptidase/acylaminoacyl peptidase
MRTSLFSIVAALLFSDGLRAADDVSFAKHVYPILRAHCWSCHSGAKPEGGLRFDGAEHLRRGGESGAAFVPGKPDASILIEQVAGSDPAMPPDKGSIGAENVDVLRRWIAAGAKIDSMPIDPTAKIVIPKVYDFAPAVTSVALHPDGKRVVAACRSEAIIAPLDGKSEPIRLPTECDLLTHVEFSPDGKVLAAAGGTPAQFGEVRFFEVASGKSISSRRIAGDTFFRGCFAPDGKSIALGGADGAAYVVPLDESVAVKRFELHSDWVVDAAWTPDGTKLVTVGRDKTTKVASIESGELLRTIDTSTERINAVVADDKLAVSAGLTRAVSGYQLDVALQNVEVSGSGNGARPVSRLAQYLRALEAQSGEVLDLTLSGDRRVLAAAAVTGDVRVYSFPDGKRVAALPKSATPIFAVALNADGSLLVTGGKSGTLDVYHLPDGKLVRSFPAVPLRKLAGK